MNKLQDNFKKLIKPEFLIGYLLNPSLQHTPVVQEILKEKRWKCEGILFKKMYQKYCVSLDYIKFYDLLFKIIVSTNIVKFKNSAIKI